MHGFSTGEETVASSMEIVKDELMRVGAVLKFHINKALIDSVKDSLSKYNADLEMKKSRRKKEGSRTIKKW